MATASGIDASAGAGAGGGAGAGAGAGAGVDVSTAVAAAAVSSPAADAVAAAAAAATQVSSDPSTWSFEKRQAGQAANLFEAAYMVLANYHPRKKAEFTLRFAKEFDSGSLPAEGEAPPVDDEPTRLKAVREVDDDHEELACGSMRFALHSMVHHHANGMDFMWDIILRYGRPGATPAQTPAFYADCVKQAATHARSFCAWEDQLRAQEAYYGSCAAPRLWAIAEPSKVSVTARLTWWLLVACAEHLDWAQVYKLRLARGHNKAGKDLVTRCHADDVAAVAMGVSYFKAAHPSGTEAHFHKLVEALLQGRTLKPIFDHKARAEAGFDRTWYEPLGPGPDYDPFKSLIPSNAKDVWERGARSRDPSSSEALAFVTERLTNQKFPVHLLNKITRYIPIPEPS